MGLMRVISRSVAYRSMAYNSEKGLLFLWGMPYFFMSNDALANFQKTLTSSFGRIVPDMLFFLGKKHGYNATKVLINKYGVMFAGDYKFFVEQGDLVGVGSVILDITDNNKKMHEIHNITSPISDAYLKNFGKQKTGVDHYLRGLGAGVSMALNGWDNLAVEDQCLAKGDSQCHMVVADRAFFIGKEKIYSDLPREVKPLEELFKKTNFDKIFEFSKADGTSKFFKFDQGKLYVGNLEGLFTALYILLMFDKVMYGEYGKKYLGKTYECGEFQGRSIALQNKLTKKVSSTNQLSKNLNLLYPLGMGNFSVSKNLVTKNGFFIENPESPFARQYLKLFSKENRPVDNYARESSKVLFLR